MKLGGVNPQFWLPYTTDWNAANEVWERKLKFVLGNEVTLREMNLSFGLKKELHILKDLLSIMDCFS